jgi:hypothetical protein
MPPPAHLRSARVEARIEAWEAVRNRKHAKVDWQFTTANARVKLKSLFPAL